MEVARRNVSIEAHELIEALWQFEVQLLPQLNNQLFSGEESSQSREPAVKLSFEFP